jgi:hypothetical protein
MYRAVLQAIMHELTHSDVSMAGVEFIYLGGRLRWSDEQK